MQIHVGGGVYKNVVDTRTLLMPTSRVVTPAKVFHDNPKRHTNEDFDNFVNASFNRHFAGREMWG